MIKSDVWLLDSHDMADAAEHYRQGCAHLFAITIDPAVEHFHNRLEAFQLDSVLFGRCRGVTQRFERQRAHILADVADTVQVIVDLEGASWRGDYDGRLVGSDDGCLRLIDMARPFDVSSDDYLTLNLMVPRAMLGVQGGFDFHGVVLSEKDPAARLLIAHLKTLWDTVGRLTSADAIGVATATAALLAGVIARHGAPTRGDERPMQKRLLADARRFVDDRLSGTDLSPEMIREHLGVSRSLLYQLFEPLGGVSSFIQARRLDRAFDAILEDRTNRRTLGETGYRHGFRTDAHFNRSFKARFGITPGQLRRLGDGARQARLSAIDQPDDVWAWLKKL